MLAGEEGVMNSQGPNRKQRAHPEWDTLRRVCLQRYEPKGTSNSSAIRSQKGVKSSGHGDSDQNRGESCRAATEEGTELFSQEHILLEAALSGRSRPRQI